MNGILPAHGDKPAHFCFIGQWVAASSVAGAMGDHHIVTVIKAATGERDKVFNGRPFLASAETLSAPEAPAVSLSPVLEEPLFIRLPCYAHAATGG